jgi:hypothetical protein
MKIALVALVASVIISFQIHTMSAEAATKTAKRTIFPASAVAARTTSADYPETGLGEEFTLILTSIGLLLGTVGAGLLGGVFDGRTIQAVGKKFVKIFNINHV